MEIVLNFQHRVHRGNDLTTSRGKNTSYIASATRLILNDFHNKGKHVECKFTIYTSHRPHCLAERALFAIDRRIYKNKNRKHIKETVDSTFLFKIRRGQKLMFQKSSFELDEQYEIVNAGCIFPFRV